MRLSFLSLRVENDVLCQISSFPRAVSFDDVTFIPQCTVHTSAHDKAISFYPHALLLQAERRINLKMADYSAVPPPATSTEQDLKIQEALARAKQVIFVFEMIFVCE